MFINSKTFLTNSVNPDVRSRVVAEIFVDDVSELPAHDGIDGYELEQGSIAYVVHSGVLYVMDSNGAWYNSEDGTAPTVPEIATQNELVTELENQVETENAPADSGIVTQNETITEPEIQEEAEIANLSGENAEEGDGNDKLV